MIKTNALSPYSGTEIEVEGTLVGNQGQLVGGGIHLELTAGGVTSHKHLVRLSSTQFQSLLDGTAATVDILSTSALESGTPHTHLVTLSYDGEKIVFDTIASNHANMHDGQVSLGIPSTPPLPQETWSTPSVRIIDHTFNMPAGSGNNTASVIHSEVIDLGVLDNKTLVMVQFYDPGTGLDPGVLSAGDYNVYPPLTDMVMIGVPDKDQGDISGSGYYTLPVTSAHERQNTFVPYFEGFLYKGKVHGNAGLYPSFIVTETEDDCTRTNIVQDMSFRGQSSPTVDVLKEVTIESMAPLCRLDYKQTNIHAPSDTKTLTGPVINTKDWTGSNPVAATGVVTATDSEYGPWWPLNLDQACLQTMYLQQNGSNTELVIKFIVIKASLSGGVNLKLAVFH